MLALVLVDAFDLNVEHRVRIDGNPGALTGHGGQLALVVALDLPPAILERRVVREFLQLP